MVIRRQLWTRSIGAHTENDRIVFLQLALRQVLWTEKLHLDADVFKRLWHVVARAHHVAYP